MQDRDVINYIVNKAFKIKESAIIGVFKEGSDTLINQVYVRLINFKEWCGVLSNSPNMILRNIMHNDIPIIENLEGWDEQDNINAYKL